MNYYLIITRVSRENYEMQGRKIAHKTSLNIGSTIKYGIYRLKQDFDLIGDYLNTRSVSLTGLYIGYSFD